MDYRIDEHNPYGSFRPGQKEAITQILDRFDEGQKIVELNAPTASGKSLDLFVLGMCLSKDKGIDKVIYTTPLVALVDQLDKEPKFSAMPVSPADRARVHKMWVDDHSYIEPFPRGHRIFDRHPCSIEEARAAGLRGWWAEAGI